MQFIVGIQPDDYGNGDRYSPMWKDLLEKEGCKVKDIDVHRADILDQLKECHGFMWRHGHMPDMRQIARRLLPVLEKELGLVVYPDQHTCWHYDDKVTQSYLLEAANIPMPHTWVFYDRDLALEWAYSVQYPVVLKLWTGTGSDNVRLLTSSKEAEYWIMKLFGDGIYGLAMDTPPKMSLKKKVKAIAKLMSGGDLQFPKPPKNLWELHKNYILFQEFMAENAFDYRIVVIGHRAFAFRRFNRPNDFRASGSKNNDTDPSNVDLDAVRVAYQLAYRLKTQSIAADILRRNGREWVVSEISYTFPHWTVHNCPGHWEFQGDHDTGNMVWHEGQMWPEEAQIQDYLCRLRNKYQQNVAV